MREFTAILTNTQQRSEAKTNKQARAVQVRRSGPAGAPLMPPGGETSLALTQLVTDAPPVLVLKVTAEHSAASVAPDIITCSETQRLKTLNKM